MMVSTKGRYALRVMIELAMHPAGEYVPLKLIAEKQEISEKYLEIIIKNLVKADYVVGLRGKGGGYRLSRPVSEYTAGKILKATEESLAPVACLADGGKECDRAKKCVTLPMWKDFYKMVDNFFENVTLESLVQQAKALEGMEA